MGNRKELIERIWKNIGEEEPVPQYLFERIEQSKIANCKSDALFKWGVETGLVLDNVDKDLNIILLSGDPKTNESISLIHSCETEDSEKRIDKLIWLLDKECSGNRTLPDGSKTANELFTAMANIVAMYVSASPQYRKGFEDCVNYWSKRIKEKPEDFNTDKLNE